MKANLIIQFKSEFTEGEYEKAFLGEHEFILEKETIYAFKDCKLVRIMKTSIFREISINNLILGNEKQFSINGYESFAFINGGIIMKEHTSKNGRKICGMGNVTWILEDVKNT